MSDVSLGRSKRAHLTLMLGFLPTYLFMQGFIPPPPPKKKNRAQCYAQVCIHEDSNKAKSKNANWCRHREEQVKLHQWPYEMKGTMPFAPNQLQKRGAWLCLSQLWVYIETRSRSIPLFPVCFRPCCFPSIQPTLAQSMRNFWLPCIYSLPISASS